MKIIKEVVCVLIITHLYSFWFFCWMGNFCHGWFNCLSLRSVFCLVFYWCVFCWQWFVL